MFDASRIYAFDIETATDGVNGLNPHESHITEIALSTTFGDAVFAGEDEATLLRDFDHAVRQLPPGLLLTWNGVFFDLPFINTRARAVLDGSRATGLQLVPAPGLRPKYDLMPGYDMAYTCTWETDEGHPHQHLDIMFGYKRIAADLGVKHSLKPVAAAHGIPMITLERDRMHEYTAEERREYAISDTRGTLALGLRLLGAD